MAPPGRVAIRRTIATITATLVLVTALVVVADRAIEGTTRARIYRSPDLVPAKRVAIVLGAKVHRDGRPSDVLEDRLHGALDLYRLGRVRRILVSGDHRRDHNDESNAMQLWLVERGVPVRDVFIDHAGVRTFDTMARAARVFLVRDAVVCTQNFHLPRSVYLARRAGIDAVGLAVARRRYRSARWNRLREVLASTRAVLDVHVLGTRPLHLGPPIPIDTADARRTHDGATRAQPRESAPVSRR